MEEFSREEMDQLYSVFRDQSIQLLDEMGQDLLLLEAVGKEEEALSRLRRGAHTIKGDASCVGLEGVAELAHRIEDVIELAVEGRIEFEADVVDWMLLALDAIRAAISGIEISDIPQEQLEGLISSLDRWKQAVGHLAVGENAQEKELADWNATNSERVVGAKVQAGSIFEKKDYVRVEARRIDSLLNLAGEMVIARSLLNQIVPELELELSRSELVGRLNGTGVQLGKLISELQKSVLKMRMIPIGAVFRRFARPMRDLAAERGKQVEILTAGDETELDRTLVESMYEPLLHLLRNCVDHGLETGEERAAKGKPQKGFIKLAAYHEGNQIVVEVSDDGRGIDCSTLKEKAIESGALDEEEAASLSEEQSLELIFLDGVSTAKGLTRISGRGIGMAAVKASIEQMRGSISLSSTRGEGTTFRIRMPLTLAIIRGLLFKASGHLFALPLLSVSEIIKTRAEEIVRIEEFEGLRHRGGFLSLIRPGAVLGYDRRKGGSGAHLRGEDQAQYIIVLNAGSGRYGVVADVIMGEQELVIKRLEGRWVQNDSLAGASLLGDGRVVLIMDAGAIIRKSIRYERRMVEAKANYGHRA